MYLSGNMKPAGCSGTTVQLGPNLVREFVSAAVCDRLGRQSDDLGDRPSAPFGAAAASSPSPSSPPMLASHSAGSNSESEE